MTERSMPVPEGLAGMRVDAGLSRLLGLSRTAAAAIAEDGGWRSTVSWSASPTDWKPGRGCA